MGWTKGCVLYASFKNLEQSWIDTVGHKCHFPEDSMCETTTIEEITAIFSSGRFVSRGNQQQHHALLLHQLKNRERREN